MSADSWWKVFVLGYSTVEIDRGEGGRQGPDVWFSPATSKKTASQSTGGVDLHRFLKMGEELYPILWLGNVIRSRAKHQGHKIELLENTPCVAA
jgi:hypothetical protein